MAKSFNLRLEIGILDKCQICSPFRLTLKRVRRTEAGRNVGMPELGSELSKYVYTSLKRKDPRFEYPCSVMSVQSGRGLPLPISARPCSNLRWSIFGKKNSAVIEIKSFWGWTSKEARVVKFRFSFGMIWSSDMNLQPRQNWALTPEIKTSHLV